MARLLTLPAMLPVVPPLPTLQRARRNRRKAGIGVGAGEHQRAGAAFGKADAAANDAVNRVGARTGGNIAAWCRSR